MAAAQQIEQLNADLREMGQKMLQERKTNSAAWQEKQVRRYCTHNPLYRRVSE